MDIRRIGVVAGLVAMLVIGSASVAGAAPSHESGGTGVIAEGQVTGDPWDEDPPPAGFEPYCEPILATSCEIFASTVGNGLGKPGEIIIKNSCKWLAEKFCKYKPPSKEIPPAQEAAPPGGCPDGSYPTEYGCEWLDTKNEEPAKADTPNEEPVKDCGDPDLYTYNPVTKQCDYGSISN